MTQAPTPGPLSGDDELIERGLRTIRTYDAVRYLRDALTATTARLTGYDWNADPESITKQQGDAFSAADRVFADLDAAVAAYPEIDLPQCEACNGTGKIEEAARTEGANQHSACVRSCDECDGCGFAPDPELAPTAPVEASGSELHPATANLVDRFATEMKSKLAKAEAKYGYRDNWSRPDWEDELTESLAEHIQKGDPRDVAAYCAFAWHHGWSTSDAAGYFAPALRPQPSGETREAVARLTRDLEAHPGNKSVCVFSDDLRTILALLRPAAPGGGDDLRAACQAVLDDYQTSETHHPDHILIRRADFERIAVILSSIPASEGGGDEDRQTATR